MHLNHSLQNFTQLDSRFSFTEDDLGEALAQNPLMIKAGFVQVLQGPYRELAGGLFGFQVTLTNGL